MKRFVFILFCFCFAFSQEYFEVNVFYSDPQNGRCNSFQSYISTFLNNPYLKTQNIQFKATHITQPLDKKLKHYGLNGKCDLVISKIKQNKEVAYKSFDLSKIIPRYDSFWIFLSDGTSTHGGFSPYKFLAWVWDFILQHSQKFYIPTIIFSLFCGLASGALYSRLTYASPYYMSVAILISSILIGGLLSFVLGKSLYPTRLPYCVFEVLSCVSGIFILVFFFIPVSYTLDSSLALLTTSLLCSIFVATTLSIRTSSETILVYCTTFLLATFLFSRLKSSLLIKTILVIASLIFLSLSILMIWIFSYTNKAYAIYRTIITIILYGCIPCLSIYNKLKLRFK